MYQINVKMLTAICILNYNNGAKTIRCLESIFVQTNSNYRILIIDNHSTDDSVGVLTRFLESIGKNIRLVNSPAHNSTDTSSSETVTLLVSDHNGGYSFGNNIGIRWAKAAGCFSHLLILNNDVVLKENFLKELEDRYHQLQLEFQTEKLALGSTELTWEEKVRHQGFYFLHLITGIVFPKPIFPSLAYLVGSSLFIPIDAPLMNASFFLYFDDIQYSKDLREEGYLLESAPNAHHYHDIGASELAGRQWVIFKSLVRFYRMNYPWLIPLVIPVRVLLIGYLAFKRILCRTLCNNLFHREYTERH